MKNIISNRPNWHDFGCIPLRKLCDEGSNPFKPAWIQGAYAWFFKRLPKSIREQYRDRPPVHGVAIAGPPTRFVSFPMALREATSEDALDFESGRIGFLAVDSSGEQDQGNETSKNDGIKQCAYDAARFVYDVFRKLKPHAGFPRVEIACGTAEGTSLSLSAMIAALCRNLKIECPNTIIATGCWDAKSKTLSPVPQETLRQKIIAAVRYGYRKFIVVEGENAQNEWDALKKMGVLPPDAELEFIEVPTDPLMAIFRILRELPNGASEEMAALLGAFDLRFLRSNAYGETDFVVETLKPFVDKSLSNLVQHVALDILCRREMHLGNTTEAERFRRETPQLSRSEFPLGRLGSYLKYEEVASKIILNMDLGVWEESEDSRLARRILDRLEGSIQDHVADVEEIRSALALANSEAQRLMFLGRLNASPETILRAWREFTRFAHFWSEIFDYTKFAGLPNETFHRQRNYCVQCKADYWHLTKKTLLEPNLPSGFDIESVADAFDLTAWVQCEAMSQSETGATLTRFFELADAFFEKHRGYPNYLPYEKVLLYRMGTDAEQDLARTQLSQAIHLAENTSGESILALLAIRSAGVLEDFAKMERIYGSLPENSRLKKIAAKMVENPMVVGFLGPY
ncbi:MAG: hypothetical protein Q4D38_13530 [Planctomycetia bacterium]|nr:hypothetical protein [Planctomycetia bacterium]